MLTIALVAVYVLHIQASALLILMMMRSQRATPARAALIMYLAATATWSALAIDWKLDAHRDPLTT